MNHHYSDIRDKIPEVPKWFDERAVPRYCDFTPDATADIYADECALALIKCQNCGHEFHVLFSRSVISQLDDKYDQHTIAERIRKNWLHYGDPPNIQCCLSGPTMNSEPVKVLEYWHKNDNHDWIRDETLEVGL
jgi:hypothetical protein